MEYIALAEFVKYGTPGVLLVLIITNVVQIIMMQQQGKAIKDIKNSITWKDTCDERHETINRRIERIENLQNSK